MKTIKDTIITVTVTVTAIKSAESSMTSLASTAEMKAN